MELVDGSLPEVLERFAQGVVSRQMETPAILFLEMMRPLNVLGAQVVHGAVPFASLVGGEQGCRELAEALEERGTVGRVLDRIEEIRTGSTS